MNIIEQRLYIVLNKFLNAPNTKETYKILKKALDQEIYNMRRESILSDVKDDLIIRIVSPPNRPDVIEIADDDSIKYLLDKGYIILE